jgi:hypothetical protein
MAQDMNSLTNPDLTAPSPQSYTSTTTGGIANSAAGIAAPPPPPATTPSPTPPPPAPAKEVTYSPYVGGVSWGSDGTPRVDPDYQGAGSKYGDDSKNPKVAAPAAPAPGPLTGTDLKSKFYNAMYADKKTGNGDIDYTYLQGLASKLGVSLQDIGKQVFGLDAAGTNAWLQQHGMPANTPTPAPPGPTMQGPVDISSLPTGIVGPTSYTMTPQMTVADRLKALMDENSPLAQQARTHALEAMNDRGLVNSSMAEGAAEQAAYNAMLQIAQQDANTAADIGKTNNAYANQFATAHNLSVTDLQKMAVAQGYNLETMTTQQINDMAKIALQGKQNLDIANVNNASQQQIAKDNNANQLAIATLQTNNQTKLADINNKFSAVIAQNNTAHDYLISANQQIQAIMAGTGTPEQKTEKSNQVWSNLQIELAYLSGTLGPISGLNIGNIINPYTPPPAPAPAPVTP